MKRMEADSSLYEELNRLEQCLDSELTELQGLFSQTSVSNKNIDDDEFHSNSRNNNGYFQTEICVVKTTTTRECHGEMASREVFYRCGRNCYQGEVILGLQSVFDPSFYDIHVMLTNLEQQKSELATCICDSDCNNDLHESNSFRSPLNELEKAQSFILSEISFYVKRLSYDDRFYYELVGDTSGMFSDVLFACSKVYSNGVVFISLYFEGVVYTAIQHDRCCLMDVNFSAYFTSDSEGSTLAMYNDDYWMKLSVWKATQRREEKVTLPSGRHTHSSQPHQQGLACENYIQSYYILKSDNQDHEREILFRFGAWCYGGRVELPTKVFLQDIPGIIREARLQQPKLIFVGDVSSLDTSSTFVKPMYYIKNVTKCMIEEAASCEVYLRGDGNKEDSQHWLEDDANKCQFFEFTCDNDSSNSSNALEAVELVCNKVYNASGVITISIYHNGNWYLVLKEGGNENPLLDSFFPDLCKRRNGCQLKTFPNGHESWPELRSLSLWQVAPVPVNGEITTTDGVLSTNKLYVAQNKQRKKGYLRSLLPLSPQRQKNR